jgi:hypothetical protein
MTSRREVLQIGFAAAVAPLVAHATRATSLIGAERPGSLPLYKALYDVRFADSVAFARRIEALGVPVHAIEGDMTRFWYDDLYHRWRQNGPVAIAGLTTHGALFCLERLAWDQRMRVVFRAAHSLDAAGCVAHDFTGPSPMLRVAKTANDSAWGAQMADVVTQCPRGRAQIVAGSAATVRPLAAAWPDRETLFSWVIAPAVRA